MKKHSYTKHLPKSDHTQEFGWSERSFFIILRQNGLGPLAFKKKSNRSYRRYAYKKIQEHSFSNTYLKTRWFQETNNTLPQLNQWACDNAIYFCVHGIQHIQLSPLPNQSITPPVVVMDCGDKNLHKKINVLVINKPLRNFISEHLLFWHSLVHRTPISPLDKRQSIQLLLICSIYFNTFFFHFLNYIGLHQTKLNKM